MPHEATQTLRPIIQKSRPITGRFVLISFVTFFGVIGSVNAVMMTLAIRTMPGLDVKNGYVASQAMNGEIEAMRRQVEQKWRANYTVHLKGGMGLASLSLIDREGKPVTGLAIKARLAHPALTRADLNASFTEHDTGVYTAEFADVQAGAWTLIVEAKRADNRVFASRNRLVLTEPMP